MNLLSKLLSILEKSQVKKFWFLEILVVFSALLETISIILIASAISILTEQESQFKRIYIDIFSRFFDISVSNNKVFFIYFTIIVLIVLLFSTVLSILTIWKLSSFAANIGGSLSSKLYSIYLSINYKEFNSIGNSHITKQIATEVSRLTDNVLQPIVQINARIISGLFIFILLFYFNPIASLLAILIFSAAYILMYLVFKNDLHTNGKKLSEIYQSRYRFLNEASGAFREIKSFGAKLLFTERFDKSSNEFAKAYSKLNTIYNSPRYVIEFVIYFSLMFFLLKVSLSSSNSSLISEISMFGLASVKLLPIFQQIFAGISQIKSHRNSLDALYKDLNNKTFQIEPDSNLINQLRSNDSLVSNDLLVFNKVSFAYKIDTPIIQNLNLRISEFDKVVIVGKSGAGKTTISDLISGLILPTDGELFFKGRCVNYENLNYLRSHVSIVSQFPFVLSGTIANNVTYSFTEFYDIEKLKYVLSQVGLLDFIESLTEGINTKVGDGGVSFSGGQLQRLAIARALYRDTSIILFDEPTSSLDPNTESIIIDMINNLSLKKTVITVSHSREVIKNHNLVILVENGNVVDCGSYDNLIKDSKKFIELMSSFENNL